MCCLSGKIVLPPLHPVPPELWELLTTQDVIGKAFCEHIHTYNKALAMTSKTDETVNEGEEGVNDGIGPYVFKLHGELFHRSGSLLPPEGESPVYAQLYIYDPGDAANFWMANMMEHPSQSSYIGHSPGHALMPPSCSAVVQADP
jgi:hypothetical protein